MVDQRARLISNRAANDEHLARLEADHARLLESAESSNSDDEHDPEGATLAFEREQLVSLVERARRTRDELTEALARIDAGSYGVCERCGGPIAPERLDARPDARTCINCAR